MANPEHLAILQKGVKTWNEWRKDDGKIKPDLSEVNLSGFYLDTANLTGAMLARADLSGANLRRTRLMGANLSGATLIWAGLVGANLSGANLMGALLGGADLSDADLSYAHLSGADLSYAHLKGTLLTRTECGTCVMGGTNFCDIDLSEARGLDNITHISPSSIGIDTLYKSRGQIPDQFLRDAGVPEEIIDIARSIRCGPPIQWHSCFISYSTTDEEFARRLHSRMRQANLRVWFAPEDAAGGKKLHEQLFEAIQLQDKLLLVLSEASMQSEWVMTETRKAREIEKKEKRRKLFPIRLVDFEAIRGWTCFDSDTGKDLAVEVREYFIPDFSNWKDHDAFESAFKRLLKDLKADGGETKAEEPSPDS